MLSVGLFSETLPATKPLSSRVTSYWVLVGVWWCESTELMPMDMPELLFSRVPTAAAWTPDPTGLLLSFHRLETGRLFYQTGTTSSCLNSCQILTAMKQYKRLPYTLVYLFSFFLLAGVCYTICSPFMALSSVCLQSINTTTTLVSICQNSHFNFSFLQVTYLGLAQGITSALRLFPRPVYSIY